jgi:MFS family permease
MGLLGTMSAVGTALGPSLGGLLIAGLGWRAIFLFNVPLGIVAYVLTRRHLPADRAAADGARGAFDYAGTALLAAALAAYALAVTLGRGQWGAVNLALLSAAIASIAAFVWVETRSAAPLVRVALFRNAPLRASLVMSTIIAAVLMSTLVVGPFYLARALGFGATAMGAIMSVGPLVAALSALPAGRLVDRWGSGRVTLAGLVAVGVGALGLAWLPAKCGLAGYLAPLVVLTGGYAFFQTANNTSVMANAVANQRGVMSGLLNLSRNLGLVTGASVMSAIFAYASGVPDVATARPDVVVFGLQVTFLVATGLVIVAMVMGAEVSSEPRQESHAGS